MLDWWNPSWGGCKPSKTRKMHRFALHDYLCNSEPSEVSPLQCPVGGIHRGEGANHLKGNQKTGFKKAGLLFYVGSVRT